MNIKIAVNPLSHCIVGVPESPAQAEMETKFKAMNFSSGNSRGEDLIHP